MKHGGFWLVVLGAALWGVDPLFRIILLRNMTSAQIVLVEHVIIAAVLVPVLWKQRAELRSIGWRQVGALLFISWGGSGIATLLFTMGLSTGDLNAVLLLQKLQPIFAIILAAIVLKEHLPRYFGWLMVLALGGTYLLTFGVQMPIGKWADFVRLGSLFAIGAAALWGGSTVMGRYMVGKLEYQTVTSLRFILALPLLVVVAWSEGAVWDLPAVNTQDFWLVVVNIAGQALLPGLLSLLVYYKGLTTTKASYATLGELSFPIVGVLINWLVFGEEVTAAQLGGFVVLWFVIFMISREQPDDAAGPGPAHAVFVTGKLKRK
jgi:drug/metabolite transporter (DMT)-like permease